MTEPTLRRVIIESPYAGNVRRHVAYARAAVRDSIMRGEAPFASHLIYTQTGILNDDIAAERQKGINVGLEWARGAHAVAFYVDLGMSRGMKYAKQRHEAEGRVIELRNLPADEVDRICRQFAETKGSKNRA